MLGGVDGGDTDGGNGVYAQFDGLIDIVVDMSLGLDVVNVLIIGAEAGVLKAVTQFQSIFHKHG